MRTTTLPLSVFDSSCRRGTLYSTPTGEIRRSPRVRVHHRARENSISDKNRCTQQPDASFNLEQTAFPRSAAARVGHVGTAVREVLSVRRSTTARKFAFEFPEMNLLGSSLYRGNSSPTLLLAGRLASSLIFAYSSAAWNCLCS